MVGMRADKRRKLRYLRLLLSRLRISETSNIILISFVYLRVDTEYATQLSLPILSVPPEAYIRGGGEPRGVRGERQGGGRAAPQHWRIISETYSSGMIGSGN